MNLDLKQQIYYIEACGCFLCSKVPSNVNNSVTVEFSDSFEACIWWTDYSNVTDGVDMFRVDLLSLLNASHGDSEKNEDVRCSVNEMFSNDVR